MTPSELFQSWLAWNARDVLEQAARRADAAGDTERAAALRQSLADDPNPTRAIDALAAQHQLAGQLSEWRWHAVTSAREQGASWADIAAATDTDPTSAREDYREHVDRAQRAADAIDIPLLDADRYHAAARDDDHQTSQGEHRRDRDAARVDGAHTDGAHTDGARPAAADLADDHERDDAMGFPDASGASPDEHAAQARSDQARAASPTDGGDVASAGEAEDDLWPFEPTEEWVPTEHDNLVLEYWAEEAERAGQHEQAAMHRRAADQLFADHDQWAADNPELADELRHAGINTRGWTHHQREGLLAARADPDGGYWQAAAEDRADRLAAAARRDAAETDAFPPTLEATGTAADGGSGWERGPDAAHWAAELDAPGQTDRAVTRPQGPRVDGDGFLVGEIELPGGLPPEDDEQDQSQGRVDDVPRWDEVLAVANRDGFVLFDPEGPGGFRALSSDERRELIDSVQAGTPAGITAATDQAPALDDSAPANQNHDGHQRGEAPDGAGAPGNGRHGGETDVDQHIADADDRGPRNEPSTGRSWGSLGQWARELPARPDRGGDDRDEISRRLDDARMRLTGYTWREGADRDEALAERREQLGRWYTDDTDHTDDRGESAGDAARPDPECSGTAPVADPRWLR